jgi:transcriptional antiterminator NusG
MNIYAFQVQARYEEKFMKLFDKRFDKRLKARQPSQTAVRLHFPRRELNERRQGKTAVRVVPVFPGYLFAELSSGENINAYCWDFRRTDGFLRFLPSNQNAYPLQGKDLEIASHFIYKDGGIAGVSRAYFDEHDRIVITEGPLLGLEGSIIKVDKRKGRAKVKLDLYNDSFAIDLAFEMIYLLTRQ